MGGVVAKRQGGGQDAREDQRGLPLRHRHSLSEFSLVHLASNLTQRFSVLSGLSVISLVSAPVSSEANRRPWTRISRKRWHQSTLENEYAHSKTVWPVAQTEALFLPEFPVGIEEKLKLIFLGEISRGAFGQVFHVKCSISNKEYAMKVLSKSQVCSLDAVGQVKQEVMIQHVCSHHPSSHLSYTSGRHANSSSSCSVVCVVSVCLTVVSLSMSVTEFVGYGELQQLWRSLGRLPENLVKIYLAQITLALDFLHNAGIIYRDLKMENILLDADGHIKLIDFGLAKWLSYGGRASTICGTLQFMAPEVLRGEEYSHSVDWWSLGIIIYSLLAGGYPLSGYDDHTSMSQAMAKCDFEPPECASAPMHSVITGLLCRDPRSRLHSFYQMQREELFKNFDFDEVKDRKISPRKILEEHIESKTRRSFHEFGGLTSTPKKSKTCVSEDMNRSYSSSHQSPTPTSMLRPPCKAHTSWNPGQRSASSPLLHPGRLGHHNSLVKSVSAGGHNGAAVPLLQSPLLRLARGQPGHPPRRARSQGAVSAGALPTAVSPLLVNVRGQRRQQWRGGGGQDEEEQTGATPRTENVASSVISGMNGVYKKCVSEEFLSGQRRLKESQTGLPRPAANTGASSRRGKAEGVQLKENFLEQCENITEEFFCDLVTSTPKKSNVSSGGGARLGLRQAVRPEVQNFQ
ncbi:putative serine/threonine-protein kinase [Chionoecetes opilio]|uniref:Putative serine/threonine-protein kinase n=1 Tax=Chionoecetes opilio TaxID=41210 RepID=A0A8J4XZD9_CHIOP|nr:putative serine/threonine-protein kinase [Chionoecetes opilio]